MTDLALLHRTAHVDLTKLFQRASLISSAIVLLIGSLVLLGWQLGIPTLEGSFTSDLAPMSVRSAIAFVAAGISLGCLQWRSSHLGARRVSQILAIAIILVGLFSLSETGLNWQLYHGFASSFFQSEEWNAECPISFGTGLNFVLIGNALLLSSQSQRGWHRLAQALTLLAALVAVNALLNNVHPIGLPPSHPVPVMALVTALAFLVLGAGIEGLHLDEAVMQMMQISRGSSEGLVCQLFLITIAIAIIEAFVLLGEQPPTIDNAVFGLSFLTIKTVVLFTFLIGWSVSLLTRIQQDYQQAEAAVEASEAWLYLAQEAAHLGRWNWDVEHDQLHWCDRQAQLFGMDPGMFSGTLEAGLRCIHPDDRAIAQQNLNRTIETQQDYYDEFRVVWSDQSVHWIASKGRCFYNAAGQVVRMSGVSFDITEHRQLQEERNRLLHLEQAARAKAEATNRMKDEFLSILSHEIRTPLNSVLGWIRLFRSRSLNSDMTARGMDALERNAEAQAQILEDLLDMAQVVQGKLQLQLHPTNIVAVIEAAIDTIRPAAQAKHIHIHTRFDSSIHRLLCDAHRFRQIMWNLLSNAVKFTPPDGRIDVTLTRVDSGIQIQVSDTGRGIDPNFLPYVFDRFRQEDSTLTRSYGGLGLGLALVRYLVELHGGKIVATSSGVGQGATFTVMLPLSLGVTEVAMSSEKHLEEDAIGIEQTAQRPQSATRQVFVVGDDPAVTECVRGLLQDLGMNVVCVTGKPAALQALEQTSIQEIN